MTHAITNEDGPSSPRYVLCMTQYTQWWWSQFAKVCMTQYMQQGMRMAQAYRDRYDTIHTMAMIPDDDDPSLPRYLWHNTCNKEWWYMLTEVGMTQYTQWRWSKLTELCIKYDTIHAMMILQAYRGLMSFSFSTGTFSKVI